MLRRGFSTPQHLIIQAKITLLPELSQQNLKTTRRHRITGVDARDLLRDGAGERFEQAAIEEAEGGGEFGEKAPVGAIVEEDPRALAVDFPAGGVGMSLEGVDGPGHALGEGRAW